ncbi:Na+/H+ antiporter [Nakamurella sp. YIM 132087]|uniref:Na+/H+ antiporter n=1 Tax=Nakamurella alba TaxID=2665158 RepID=A0A7K1FNT7_9ACTN|nr:Na+/H+ antiporter [Nakamurella alba]MTD15806.1 Na+/H+ antiporter [Nakamurella alba]
MHSAIIILEVAATVLAVTALCRRLRLPAPLVLVVVGIGLSYIGPSVELTPELVLLGFLPPLLYAAAIRTSLIDIRANLRTIGLLAVGLVLFTMVCVGVLTAWLLPVPLAAALAFGAVIAPPDAVAATAVARRIGLPRQVVTVLEGESLLNDATALVALRTAGLAMAGTVTVGSVGLDFLRAAGGGAVIGLAVAFLISLLRKRLTDTVSDTSLSFMAPFLAYIPAEEVEASGVIAVVIAGLILGHKAPVIQDAQSRLSERINWNTIQFILENTVFLLLGMQLRSILEAVAEDDLSAGTTVLFCVVALVAAMVVRPVWVFLLGYLLPRRFTGLGTSSWKQLTIVSWAGMRGVVTIAAAFLLPENTPHRPTLVLGAFVVTAGTLLVQGLTLPALARSLHVRGPDRREDVLQQASVMQAAVAAGVKELENVRRPEDSDEVIRRLCDLALSRPNRLWERLGGSESEPPSAQYRRLRLAMLAAERAEVLRIRDEAQVDQEILSTVLATLDVEESIMTVYEERIAGDATELTTPEPAAGDCEHLTAAVDCAVPKTPEGCPDCVREGTVTVHLRMCLECGNIGCCDSSTGRHAERHFHESGHPVMRSFEPGESWRWCYVDEILG